MRRSGERDGSTVTEVPGSHAVYVSQLGAVVAAHRAGRPRLDRPLHSKGEDEMLRSIRNHIPFGRGIAATLAVILTLGLGLSVTAAAAASNSDPGLSPKPTIVFVHGGWADSSNWNQE